MVSVIKRAARALDAKVALGTAYQGGSTMGKTLIRQPGKAARTALALDQVTDLQEVQVIRAVRGNGQSTAAGVLVGTDNDEEIIAGANALAARLGIIPVGHWRRTGPFGAPEFYAADVVTGLSWLRFLVSQGIDPEDERAIEVMFED